MNPNDTIRLLILNDSRSEAERLISMLRNAGRPTRAQHVESEEVLTKLLQEQAWDLLIAHENSQQVAIASAVKHIKRLNRDVPVILMTEQEGSQPVVDGMKLGAVDVVRMDEDQHLLLVISREMENHEQRQLRRRADRRYKEAERRSQQLLDSSRDAIAYLQDGMYLYANESFAEMFGYDDRDDIECMPVIDMIDRPDQDNVKNFLKEFALRGDDGESTNLQFRGIKHGGGFNQITVQVANAIYDEEPCIQFMVRASAGSVDSEELAAQINEIKHQDIATGLYNRQYFINRLQISLSATAESNSTSALLSIEVDNFAEKIQPAVGMAGSDMVLSDIASVLKNSVPNADTIARFGDNAFCILINNTSADKSLAVAEALCKKVDDHIIEVEGRTVQTTLSIGVALISETSNSAESVIEQSLTALNEVREVHPTAGVGNGAKLYEPPVSEDSEENMAASVKAALDKDRFRLLFQPIISLRGSEEEHYEVLLRMLNDGDEEVSPYKFLEAAEQIGAHIKIDRWVILESIKLLSKHRKSGNKTKLIVNLTCHSMTDKGLPAWLGVAFKAADLSADSLIFQVSEPDVANHLNVAKAFVAEMKKIGSATSINNFGCSLNPMNTLKHVPTGYVKVDGSFTLDIQNNNESPETLTNLLKDLHAENKITIVPFVENASVLSTLWQAGVHYIQGHYLQAPSAEMSYDFSMDS
jgi:diguanylate cyclase (GGDEF)-like protein/PAS domain S-box-containing protein